LDKRHMKVSRWSALRIGHLRPYDRSVTTSFCQCSENFVIWQGGLSQRKISMTPYNCSCCLSYQIYHHNTTVSATCPIRYTPTILLFLLPVLSDISPQYYSFCCLSYKIYPHNTTVSTVCPIRNIPTILLFLLPVLSDILPHYYCFCCLSYQINPHHNTVSAACPIRYTPKILLFLLPVLSDIPPQYYCFCCLSYQIYPHNTTVSTACAVKGTSTAHRSILDKGHFILYCVVL